MGKYIDAEKLIAEIERQQRRLILLANTEQVSVRRDCNLQNGVYSYIISTIASLQQEQPPFPSNLDEAAIQAAQIDMCDRQIMEDSNEHRMLYSRIFRRGFKAGVKWQQEQEQEQPEVELEKEIIEHAENMPHGEFTHDSECREHEEWAMKEFRHFYELARQKYEK